MDKKEGYWNHRLLHYRDLDGEHYFKIEEVHYYGNDKPRMHGDAQACGSTFQDVKGSLNRMRRCLTKPILDGDNWPQEWKEEPL